MPVQPPEGPFTTRAMAAARMKAPSFHRPGIVHAMPF
jgi:hypothetical protein